MNKLPKLPIIAQSIEEYMKLRDNKELHEKYRGNRGWLSYKLKIEDLNNPIVVQLFSHRPDILNMMKHIDEICISHNKLGIFKGVELTDEDYYWIYIDEDSRYCYNTCVDKCEPTDWKVGTKEMVPGDLYIINSLHTFDYSPMHNVVGRYFETDEYDYFEITEGENRGMCISTSRIFCNKKI